MVDGPWGLGLGLDSGLMIELLNALGWQGQLGLEKCRSSRVRVMG